MRKKSRIEFSRFHVLRVPLIISDIDSILRVSRVTNRVNAYRLGINFYSFNYNDIGNRLISEAFTDGGQVSEIIHPGNLHAIALGNKGAMTQKAVAV